MQMPKLVQSPFTHGWWVGSEAVVPKEEEEKDKLYKGNIAKLHALLLAGCRQYMKVISVLLADSTYTYSLQASNAEYLLTV